MHILYRLFTIIGVSCAYKVKQNRPSHSTDNPEKVMKILINIPVRSSHYERNNSQEDC